MNIELAGNGPNGYDPIKNGNGIVENLPSRSNKNGLRLDNPHTTQFNENSAFSPNPVTLSPTILPEEDSNDFDHPHTINMGSETEDMLNEEIIIDRMYMKAIELHKRQSVHKTQSPTKVILRIFFPCWLSYLFSVD